MAAINNGKDFNFYQKYTVTSTTFKAVEDIQFLFKGQTHFTLANAGAAAVEYSFNGNTLHGELGPVGSATAFLTFPNRRVTKIWFRTASGSNVVRVEAWAGV